MINFRILALNIVWLTGLTVSMEAAVPNELQAVPVSNKLGLSLNQYAFSWKVESQQGYRILVASDLPKLAAEVGDLWDSGRRNSGEFSNIVCGGKAFPDGAKVWWKVQIWDESGVASAFSSPAIIQVPNNTRSVKPQRRTTHRIGEGGLDFVDGRIGKALRFGRGRPGLQSEDYQGLRSRNGTTISAWIRPKKVTDIWQCVYRKEDGDNRRILAIGKEGPFWGLWFGINIAGYKEIGGRIDPAKLLDGQWHHVAASYDGSSVRLFLDGVKIGEQKISGNLGSSGTASAFIGSLGGQREIFEGGIDDVRIYSQGLSENALAKLADGETVVENEGLAGHWKLDGNINNETLFLPPSPVKNRVVFLGDSLISRMEKFGFLETALTAHWPHHNITFRNLGWPGDDVFGTARAEFKDGRNTRGWESGPPDGVGYRALLRQVSDADASTIIVGYGSGVAFAEAGITLDRFRAGYARLMGALAAKGETLILLTPPRQEATGSPVPDLIERNRRLGEASSFIIGIGKKHGHLVIDLHGQLSAPETEPITENGVQLNELGYRRVAGLLTRKLGLFEGVRSLVTIDSDSTISSHGGATVGEAVTTGRGIRFDLRSDQLPCYFLPVARKVSIPSAVDAYRLKVDGVDVLEGAAAGWESGYAVSRGPEFDATDKLRAAIIGKNLQHRRRLRPLNKTYVLLFRAYEMGHLAYEMGDFDRLVTAAEERIARLRIPHTHRYSIERIDPWKPVHNDPEHEVPRFIPAPDIADELSKMEVPEGYQLNLFSADPILTNPINLNWDTRGRAWVSMSSTYPHIKPGTEPNDRIVILEDQDQNGIADKHTVFADGLLVPHSVMPVKGGAYVCSATEFLFLADTDGDDRADKRRVVFSGFGNADVHHMIHALRWAPWGELYFNQSIYINSFIDTRWGKRRLNGSGVWRFRPETERLEVFARGTVNPWGHAIDRWGQSFITDGAGGQGPHYTFPGAAFRSAVGAPRTLPGLTPGKPNGTGCEVLSGRHFPAEWRGSIVENDFRANRTVRYRITETSSGYTAEEVETLIRSSRKTFRPVDLKVGPDGALYIVDWYNAIIDHGEVDFHHPLRDKAHGRIWRLIVKDRSLVERPNIHGAAVESLLEYLKAPEGYSRMQAKRELSTRPRDKVLPKLESWLTGLSSEDPEFEHHYLEALWLYDTMNTPNEKLLRKVLASPESRARASGVRILFHWRDHVDKPFELFAAAINDEHPQVRLEAVNMLREIGSLEAANIAIRALRRPVDQWLDYAIWLTARELRDAWLPALQSGKEVFGGATDQLRYALEATGDPRATERLVALLRDSKINENATPNVVKTIAALGNAPEVDYILTLADKQPSLLVSIAEGARHNAAKPDRATSVIEHITHGDRTVREAAAELAGIWRVTGADDVLASRVRNAQDASEHLIAARALARLKQFDRLAGLASSTQDQNVRIAAVAAWAEAQPEEARRPAVEILVSASQSEDIKPIFEAFINRASGASQLAEALEKFRLKEAIAITGIRLVRASGREFPELIVALNKAGALKPVAFDLTQHEREDLLTHVITSGDAKRGAEVYRRKSMACTLCHQIGTEGGKVGPELSSIGAYAQPAAILDSILSPNNDIKQGFETVIVTRKDDTTIAGVLQRRSDSATIIRDPANKIVEIPNVDVKKSAKSPVSLMPAGLTATLRNDELVDLIRYLTELDGNGDARPLHPQQK